MEWCCSIFKDRYETAGMRGTAILVGRNSIGNAEFRLQYRAVDKDIAFNVSTEYPISILTDEFLNYCPWCGRNLDDWYGPYVDDLFRSNLSITDS